MACKYLTNGDKGRSRRMSSLGDSQPVAGRAKTVGPHPRQARLDIRIKSWETPTTGDAGPKKRWTTGGYHKPGSYNK